MKAFILLIITSFSLLSCNNNNSTYIVECNGIEIYETTSLNEANELYNKIEGDVNLLEIKNNNAYILESKN